MGALLWRRAGQEFLGRRCTRHFVQRIPKIIAFSFVPSKKAGHTRLLTNNSVTARARQTYDPAPRAEQSYFHGVGIQTQNIGNLLDRKTLHFLQDQHQPVTFLEAFQEPLNALTGRELFADVRLIATRFARYRVLPRLIFTQV
jgi:hypothetical protein